MILYRKTPDKASMLMSIDWNGAFYAEVIMFVFCLAYIKTAHKEVT